MSFAKGPGLRIDRPDHRESTGRIKIIQFFDRGGLNPFSFLVGLSATLGLAWIALRNPASAAEQAQQEITAGLWALAGALIGARLVYVAFNWTTFQSTPWEIVQVWLGGLTWTGGVTGAMIGLAAYAWVNNQSIGRLADTLIPLWLMVTTGIWMANWRSGIAYGIPAPQGAWWGVPAVDEWGTTLPRLPLQPLAALINLILYAGLDQSKRWFKRPGTASLLAWLGLNLQMIAVSLFRTDPGPSWNGLRLETWAAIAFCMASLVLLFITWSGHFGPEMKADNQETESSKTILHP